jgi:hypothetical protein
MRAVRVLAGIVLLFAAIAFISDFTRWSTGGGLSLTSIAGHWRGASPTSFAAVQTAVSRTLHPWLWDPLLLRLLSLPAFVTLGLLGLLLARLGRERYRVNIFVN